VRVQCVHAVSSDGESARQQRRVPNQRASSSSGQRTAANMRVVRVANNRSAQRVRAVQRAKWRVASGNNRNKQQRLSRLRKRADTSMFRCNARRYVSSTVGKRKSEEERGRLSIAAKSSEASLVARNRGAGTRTVQKEQQYARGVQNVAGSGWLHPGMSTRAWATRPYAGNAGGRTAVGQS